MRQFITINGSELPEGVVEGYRTVLASKEPVQLSLAVTKYLGVEILDAATNKPVPNTESPLDRDLLVPTRQGDHARIKLYYPSQPPEDPDIQEQPEYSILDRGRVFTIGVSQDSRRCWVVKYQSTVEAEDQLQRILL